MIKRSLLALGFWLGLTALAVAQVNVVPQIGVTTAILKQTTYSAVSIALVPASSATDIFCINGSSTKAISIKRVELSGVAGTAVTAPFTLLRRATLDTGGTAATSTAAPVATPNESSDVAATATLIAYTANPTINDSSPVYLRSDYLTLPTSSSGSNSQFFWAGGEEVGWFTKALNIPKGSTAQQYCINLNAVSVSSGLLHIAITWVEN